jgi:hypothetical protein
MESSPFRSILLVAIFTLRN